MGVILSICNACLSNEKLLLPNMATNFHVHVAKIETMLHFIRDISTVINSFCKTTYTQMKERILICMETVLSAIVYYGGLLLVICTLCIYCYRPECMPDLYNLRFINQIKHNSVIYLLRLGSRKM